MHFISNNDEEDDKKYQTNLRSCWLNCKVRFSGDYMTRNWWFKIILIGYFSYSLVIIVVNNLLKEVQNKQTCRDLKITV